MEVLGSTKYGSYDVLESRTLSLPTLTSLEYDVMIQVAYSDVNPVDLQKLSVNKPAGTPIPNLTGHSVFVPGYGGSGTILEVGTLVPAHWKGKQACFIVDPTRPGSYATHVVVDYRCVALLPPSGITLQEAATIPIAGLTALECLVKVGLMAQSKIHDGKVETVGRASKIIMAPSSSSDSSKSTLTTKTLLIIGGAGGVGSWIITLARAWHPHLNIIATASTTEQQTWCQNKLGANQVLHHDRIRDQLVGGPQGSVDAIICLTEPTQVLFGACAEVIKPYGHICLVVAGKSIETLDLSFVFFKGATVSTETVFTSIRTKFQQIVPSHELDTILQLVSKQTIHVPLSPDIESGKISERWKDALTSQGVLHALSQSSGRRGKYVMKIQPDEELIFIDMKTASLLSIPRDDCIKAKILTLIKGEDGTMEWKEQTHSAEREQLVEKIVKHKQLGIVKVTGKQVTDYVDGLEMQEAVGVKNLWGVELKKRSKNVQGEEVLFLDPNLEALGEVSRSACISTGLLVLEKDQDGKETVQGAIRDVQKHDEMVQVIRKVLKLNFEVKG